MSVCNVGTSKCLFSIKTLEILNDCGRINDLYNGVYVTHAYVEVNVVDVKRIILLSLKCKCVSALGNSNVTDNDIHPLTSTVCRNYVSIKRNLTGRNAVLILAEVKIHLNNARINTLACRVSYAKNECGTLEFFCSSKCETEIVPSYTISGKILITTGNVSISRSLGNKAVIALSLNNTGSNHIDKLCLNTIGNGIVLAYDFNKRCGRYGRNNFNIDGNVVASALALINYSNLSITRLGCVGFNELAILDCNFFLATVNVGSDNLKTFSREFFTKGEFKLCTGSIQRNGFDLKLILTTGRIIRVIGFFSINYLVELILTHLNHAVYFRLIHENSRAQRNNQ